MVGHEEGNPPVERRPRHAPLGPCYFWYKTIPDLYRTLTVPSTTRSSLTAPLASRATCQEPAGSAKSKLLVSALFAITQTCFQLSPGRLPGSSVNITVPGLVVS